MNNAEKLTDKQVAFCHQYLIDWNAKNAAIRAGYSQKTAKIIGCQNLANQDIKDYISELKNQHYEALNLNFQDILLEYKRIAFFNPIEVLSQLNNGAKIEMLPIETQRMITQIKVTTDKEGNQTTSFKFKDSEKALTTLYQHLKQMENTGIGKVVVITPEPPKGGFVIHDHS